jgi:folate-dependent phosphoribosylglycinamide formyltransferase PurN
MANKWITFFSQTGAEIADLSESIGRWPDLIITNKRPDHLRTIDPRIVEYGYTEVPNKPTVSDLDAVLQDNAIITLHGWLRIMPEVICNKYLIYNGHPGLITKYPELKGKDPQVKAHKLGHEVAGAVIHKVTAGVDEGRIIMEEYFNATQLDLDELFRILRDRSLYMWSNLLKQVL